MQLTHVYPLRQRFADAEKRRARPKPSEGSAAGPVAERPGDRSGRRSLRDPDPAEEPPADAARASDAPIELAEAVPARDDKPPPPLVPEISDDLLALLQAAAESR
jgi:hypothetical protein